MRSKSMASSGSTQLPGRLRGLSLPRQVIVLAVWPLLEQLMNVLVGTVDLTLAGHLHPSSLAVSATAQPLLELAPTPLRICGPVQIFLATQMVLSGALRGAGDTRATMWITLSSMLVVRVPAAYLAGVVLGLGLNGIWYAMAIETTLRSVLLSVRFFSNLWIRVTV